MLILFDMDGVLVNSEKVILKSAMKALSEYGVFANKEDFREFIGAGEDRFVGGVAEKYGALYQPEMKKRTYEIYHTLVQNNLEVYKNTIRTLKELHALGFDLALASSADREKVDVNLKTANIPTEIFKVIVTGNDTTAKKPSPEIFQKAALKANYQPDSCLVIEDAINGIHAAKAADMKVIAITTSFPRIVLANESPDYIIDDLYEILPILKNHI